MTKRSQAATCPPIMFQALDMEVLFENPSAITYDALRRQIEQSGPLVDNHHLTNNNLPPSLLPGSRPTAIVYAVTYPLKFTIMTETPVEF